MCDPASVLQPDAPLSERVVAEEELSHVQGCFLDYGGSGLYIRSQIEAASHELTSSLLGNPHSLNRAGGDTRQCMDEARRELLESFGVTEQDYTVVFTAGATAALRMVGDLFPFGPTSTFAACCYNHNSVLGIRELCTARGGRYQPLQADVCNRNALPGALRREAPASGLSGYLRRLVGQRGGGDGPSLVAVPMVDNFSGRVFDPRWCGAARETGWYSLLDAAAAFGKRPIDLSRPEQQPDFVAVSFYKAFGYPTGLGALLVRKQAEGVLRKTYFGGGTVDASSAFEQWHVPRKGLSDRLEDGTPSFLSIAAARHGIRMLRRLDPGKVRDRVHRLTAELREGLAGMRHGNGLPVCLVYGHQSGVLHSGVVSFNLFDVGGEPVGYAAVVEAANVSGVHLRGGCFCNPGACQDLLRLTAEDVRQHREAGHVCGDAVDVVGGKPTGAVRASLGPFSSAADVSALLSVVRRYFVTEAAAPAPLPAAAPDTVRVDSLWVYPIKGARGLRVLGSWPITKSGLLFDRLWCVAAADGAAVGNPLGQKACPPLGDLQPLLDIENRALVLTHVPSGRSLKVPMIPDGRIHGALSVRGSKRSDGIRYGDSVSQWFTEILGRPAHFVHRPPANTGGQQGAGATLANQSALLVVNTASVAAFNETLSVPVDPRRYRANVLVDGHQPWAEDRWVSCAMPHGGSIVMGEPCARCTQITISTEPPYRPALDGEPLRTLMGTRRIRGQAFFGVHAGVEGSVFEGDFRSLVSRLAEVAGPVDGPVTAGVQPALPHAVVQECSCLTLCAGATLKVGQRLKEPPSFECAAVKGDGRSGGAAA